MNQNRQLHIDSALRQLSGLFTSGKGGDYSDFLKRLEEHDRKYLFLDAALEEKLIFDNPVVEGSWKKIIALIWYRRIRNTAILLLLISGLGYGIRYFTNTAKKDMAVEMTRPFAHQGPASTDNNSYNNFKGRKPKPEGANDIGITDIENLYNITPSKVKDTPSERKVDIATNPSIHNDATLFASETDVPESRISLKLCQLKKLHFSSGSVDHIIKLPFAPLASLKKKKQSGFDLTSGLIIGFTIGYSSQKHDSKLNTSQSETTNRNYHSLSNNGKMTSQTINYGVFAERSLYKRFGVSLGINKFTLLQEQRTDFLLTEAPVFDMDGHIAGYIAITPEKIQTHIVNRIDYVSIPLNIIYGLQLNKYYSIQFNSGTVLMGTVRSQTQKFNYTTLDLQSYNNSSSKLSASTFQYGLSVNRSLRYNFLLSLGWQQQLIYEVGPLSDNTETISSTINHINFSIKYKL